MSFATRCTACGTIFRVVQDQLKVSDGWVRCGRCDAVFDAAAGLFDLEQETPPAWQPTPPPFELPTAQLKPTIDGQAAAAGAVAGAGAGAADTFEATEATEATQATDAIFQSEDERRWSASMAAQGLTGDGNADAAAEAAAGAPPVFESAASSAAPASPAAVHAFDSADVPALHSTAAGFNASGERVVGSGDGQGFGVDGTLDNHDDDDDAIVITDHPSSLRSAAEPVAADRFSATDGAHSTEAEPAPGFLRHRGRPESRWQGGRARAGLGLLALVLLAVLVLQVAQHDSELTAARWPALRPVLTAWCGLSGCSVGPPHHIDDIVVESTGLSPAPAGASASAGAGAGAGAGASAPAGAASAPPAAALRLAVTLRNRAGYAVALPSIDLSLTDMSGKLIARRALSPADFTLLAATVVPAAAELPLQAVLTTASGLAPVSGYTVEIFYP